MKKLPVCKACISGSLCFACQKKFDEGYITQFDMDLANDLLELEEEYPSLSTASFYNAVDVGEIVFLVIGKGDKPKFTTKLLEYIKNLYSIPEIALIEKGSPKELLGQLISPAKMLGINQIYIPTGDTEYRVVISKEDKDKLKIPLNLLEDAAAIIIRGITKLSFK